ncbi:MAG: hypothetical protein SVT56_02555, partial [Chloroflexota bacterium]|nr:hypothetical protein [Chloroflexota bacterium]
MELILVFVITFVFFMAIWIIALLIGRAISKKKLSSFRKYMQDQLPEIDPDNQDVLIAKQVSKHVRPDIALVISEEDQEILILQDIKDQGISHQKYDFSDLVEVTTTH